MKSRRINGVLLDFAVVIVAVVLNFVAGTMGKCNEQGGWLFCSGELSYPTSAVILMVLAGAVVIGNFLLLPILTTGRSFGKLLTGTRVVDAATGSPVSMARNALRGGMQVLLLGGAAYLVPESLAALLVGNLFLLLLVEFVVLLASGRRLLDRVLRTDVR